MLRNKNSLLEFEKDFKDLKNTELRDREIKLEKKQKSYFLNQLTYLKMIWINLKKEKSQQCVWSWNKSKKTKNQKQSKDSIIKDERNLFRLKEENEAIKDRIIRDIKNFFQQ